MRKRGSNGRATVAGASFLLSGLFLLTGLSFCDMRLGGHAVGAGIMALLMACVGFWCIDDVED